MPNRRLKDWESTGSVFLQDGRLYASPNCKRPVIIPREVKHEFEIFPASPTLDYDKFKQPVWWKLPHEWLFFVPLSPSFISTPFAALCWFPRIEKISHKGTVLYQLLQSECSSWLRAEKQIIEAAMKLRMKYRIEGNIPPVPAHTNFDGPFVSRERLEHAVRETRKWFMIWMGFLAHIIAAVETKLPEDLANDIPCWYNDLLEEQTYWSESWLNGLAQSSVGTFDPMVLRAGVVFRWHDLDDHGAAKLDFFFEYCVPVFYPWTADEEALTSRRSELNYLEPPSGMVQEALTLLYKTPSLPFAALVIANYVCLTKKTRAGITRSNYVRIMAQAKPVRLEYDILWDADQIKEMAALLRSDQAELEEKVAELRRAEHERFTRLAQEAANIPMEGMLEEDDDTRTRSTLVSDVEQFFKEKEERTAECIKTESPSAREKRLNRERAQGVKKADVYVWSKVTSSGGKDIYLRTRVSQRWKQSEFDNYGPTTRRYNSYFNEWDLCEYLDKRTQILKPWSGDSDSDSDFEWPLSAGIPGSSSAVASSSSTNPPSSSSLALSSTNPPSLSSFTSTSTNPVPSSTVTSSTDTGVYQDDEEDDNVRELCEGRELLESMSFSYGFVPELASDSQTKVGVPNDKKWVNLVKGVGFWPDKSAEMAQENWSASLLQFYDALVSGGLDRHPSLDDLNPSNRASLANLVDFSGISRPSKDLFVFSEPRSKSVKWALGVHTPEVAVYTMRYILANEEASVLNIAEHLIGRGIACRTLYKKKVSSRLVTISKNYAPSSFRLHDHVFTGEDFQAWGSQTRELLRRPQGRAALLKGGIVATIAFNFLGMDDALAGPSAEVDSGVGFVCPSDEEGMAWMDDELTEHEIALICGANTMYEQSRDQYTYKYWFPPPAVWDNGTTCGRRWVEWTQNNSTWFSDRWYLCHSGKGQPLTKNKWISLCRGVTSTRKMNKENRARAEEFVNKHLPLRDMEMNVDNDVPLGARIT